MLQHSIYRHMRNVHNGLKSECIECGVKLNSGSKARHMRNIHKALSEEGNPGFHNIDPYHSTAVKLEHGQLEIEKGE